MSFGSYADSSLVVDALSLAYSTSVLAAAAGNDGRPRWRCPFYPAHYTFVLGVEAGEEDGDRAGFSNSGNYWWSTDPEEIGDAIYDFYDNSGKGVAMWDPPLTSPDPEAPPVVADIVLYPPSPVSVGTLIFTITFSHPMNTTIHPEVFFGPAKPWSFALRTPPPAVCA